MTQVSDLATQKDDIKAEIQTHFANSFKELIDDRNIKQKQISDDTTINSTTISEYKNNKLFPTIDHIIILAEYFKVPFVDMLIPDSYKKKMTLEVGPIVPNKENVKYELHLGNYYLTYFNTHDPIGGNTRASNTSFNQGVITTYMDAESIFTRYRAKAIMGFNNNEEIKEIKKVLDGLKKEYKSNRELAAKIDDKYKEFVKKINDEESKLYDGWFSIAGNYLYFNLLQNEKDVAVMSFWNSAQTKPYRGGLGTISSISRGQDQAPCVQLIAASHEPLLNNENPELLEEFLALAVSNINIEDSDSIDEIITIIKELYSCSENDNPIQELDEKTKKTLIRSVIDNIVNKELKRNAFRYQKVLLQNDKEFYKVILKKLSNEDQEGNND